MARFAVTTPAAGHSGLVGNVYFHNGQAEVDDTNHAAELAYFRQAGYHVEPLDGPGSYSAAEVESIESAAADAKPKKAAPVADWRAYATSDAAGDLRLTPEEAEAATKNQLVERFADSEEETQ